MSMAPSSAVSISRGGAGARRGRGGVRRTLSNGGWMARRTPQQPLEHRLLLTATFCLLAGGAVMVYSASSARSLLQGQGDGTAYLVKYLAYGAIGLVAMNLISKHGLGAARRYSPILLLIAFVLLLAVLLPGIGL